MGHANIEKIELTEIADYRGNLSFAEQDNPIPFNIKSTFWTTINKNHTFIAETKLFLLPLDGKININNNIVLERPCQSVCIAKGSEITINLISENAILLFVSDKKINDCDISKETNNGLLEMPFTENHHGLRGYFVNAESTLTFDIKRVYFTYDIPDFSVRGGHAHRELESVIFAIKGGFNLEVENSSNKETYHLNKSNAAVFLNKNCWRDINGFKENSILLVLASEKYQEKDYIRNYENFCTEIKNK